VGSLLSVHPRFILTHRQRRGRTDEASVTNDKSEVERSSNSSKAKIWFDESDFDFVVIVNGWRDELS
jgi:hypothetical protein